MHLNRDIVHHWSVFILNIFKQLEITDKSFSVIKKENGITS